jgi:hypothetical protein
MALTLRKNPDGQLVPVVKVYGDEHHGYDLAVLRISPELLTLLRERVEQVQALQVQALAAGDRDLTGVSWADCTPEYYGADYDYDDEPEPEDADGNPAPEWEREEHSYRTELDELFIDRDGDLRWTACIKHTDTRIETESVTLQELSTLYLEVQGAMP